MKHEFPTASCVARLIERAACAARFRGKTGKGKISTEALALILAHPGEAIFPETGVGGAGCRVSAISPEPDLRSPKTPGSMPPRVEFPTAARGCVRVKRRTRATVENSCPAVQHLTKALFLSKPVEPLLTFGGPPYSQTALDSEVGGLSRGTTQQIRTAYLSLERPAQAKIDPVKRDRKSVV